MPIIAPPPAPQPALTGFLSYIAPELAALLRAAADYLEHADEFDDAEPVELSPEPQWQINDRGVRVQVHG